MTKEEKKKLQVEVQEHLKQIADIKLLIKIKTLWLTDEEEKAKKGTEEEKEETQTR